jgi:hypothetical protein
MRGSRGAVDSLEQLRTHICHIHTMNCSGRACFYPQRRCGVSGASSSPRGHARTPPPQPLCTLSAKPVRQTLSILTTTLVEQGGTS